MNEDDSPVQIATPYLPSWPDRMKRKLQVSLSESLDRLGHRREKLARDLKEASEKQAAGAAIVKGAALGINTAQIGSCNTVLKAIGDIPELPEPSLPESTGGSS